MGFGSCKCSFLVFFEVEEHEHLMMGSELPPLRALLERQLPSCAPSFCEAASPEGASTTGCAAVSIWSSIWIRWIVPRTWSPHSAAHLLSIVLDPVLVLCNPHSTSDDGIPQPQLPFRIPC